MAIQAFVDAIIWPNGEGETPCSQAYSETFERQNSLAEPYLKDDGSINLDDFSVADYNEYFVLQTALDLFQLHGHVGIGFKYADAGHA